MQFPPSSSFKVMGALAVGLANSASALALPVSDSVGSGPSASNSARSGLSSCKKDGSSSELCDLENPHSPREVEQESRDNKLAQHDLGLRSAIEDEAVVDPKLLASRQLPQGSLPAAVPVGQVQQIPGQVIGGASQGGVAYFSTAGGGIVEEIIPAGFPVQPQSMVPGAVGGALQSEGEDSSNANAVPAPFSQVVGVPGQVAQSAGGVFSGGAFPGPVSGAVGQFGGLPGQVGGMAGQVAGTAGGIVYGVPVVGQTAGGMMQNAGANPIGAASNVINDIPVVGGTAGGIVQGVGSNPFGTAGGLVNGIPVAGGAVSGIVQGVPNPLSSVQGVAGSLPLSSVTGAAGSALGGTPLGGIAGSLPLGAAGNLGNMFQGEPAAQAEHNEDNANIPWSPSSTMATPSNTPHLDPGSPDVVNAMPPPFSSVLSGAPMKPSNLPMQPSNVTSKLPNAPAPVPSSALPFGAHANAPSMPVPAPSVPVAAPSSLGAPIAAPNAPSAPIALPSLPIQPPAPNGLPVAPSAPIPVPNAPAGMPSAPIAPPAAPSALPSAPVHHSGAPVHVAAPPGPDAPIAPPSPPVSAPGLPVQPPSDTPSKPTLPVQPPGAPTSVLSMIPLPSAPNMPTPPVSAPILPTPSAPAKPFQKLARWVGLAARDAEAKSSEGGHMQTASSTLPSGFPAPSEPIPGDQPPLLDPANHHKREESGMLASMTATASTLISQPSRRSVFRMFKRQE